METLSSRIRLIEAEEEPIPTSLERIELSHVPPYADVRESG